MKFNKKSMEYGGYASIMTAVVIIMVIIINMVVGQLNIKFDLTKNQIYTLSEDTTTLLNELNEEIKIYSVYPEGGEIPVVLEILNRYANSKNVTISTVDPYKNPQFATQYAKDGQAVSIGSVVVTTSSGYQIITQEQLADIYTEQTTGESYLNGIKLEGVLTGAIRKLTSGETVNVYTLVGHGEMALDSSLLSEMDNGGYTVSTVNLITEGKIPEDAQVLIINALSTDITTDELSIINDYLANGGKLFVTLGMTVSQLPNFDSLLSNYGVANSYRMVMEGDANYAYQQNPYYLIPQVNSEHSITARLKEAGTSIFIPFALNIDFLETKRSTVTAEAIATTSSYAYSKAMADMSNVQMAETDPKGPFALGVAITDVDNTGNNEGVKLVVYGAETIMEGDINTIVNGGNYGAVMNSFDWLVGNETVARSKSLGADDYLMLTQGKALTIVFISVILIPAIILFAGIFVAIKRRNK